MVPDADADPTTFREDVEAYRTAVNNEAQSEAETLKETRLRQSDGDQVIYLGRSLGQRDTVIARVRALLDGWVPQQANYGGTHSEFCYQWHPDCLVQRIQDALRTMP